MTCPWITVKDVPIVRTTCGELFTGEESALLAYGIYKRFGCDIRAALKAYERLMQSDPTEEGFGALICFGESLWKRTQNRVLHTNK